MADLEKKTYRVTLIRAFATAVSLVACTWQLSSKVTTFTNKIDGLEDKINILVKDKENHAKQDSIKDMEIARIKHRMDSDEKVLGIVALTSRVKYKIKYYTQRKVNGHLITEEAND